jgi:cytochrome bd ubiquinol oxidase subunit II
MDLQTLWFVLIVVLWSGYFLLEGFDFGVGMLLPFVPGTEPEREAMFESIGPVWDGNEVWLVVAAGATFAAFPAWYATMFSGFYLALLLLLFFLIIRVVSFEWRSKSESPRWRAVWLWANAIGSTGIALVWGIALANLIHGVPLDSNGDYDGNLVDLFTPYTLFAGIAFVLMFAFHGATYLGLRTEGGLHRRVGAAARRLALPAAIVGGTFLIWTVVVAVDRNDKDVFPVVVPAVLGIVALGLAALLAFADRSGLAFTMTALGSVAAVATLFTGLYPRVIVSSPNFSNSLDISAAASAHYTLAVLTVIALIVLPIVLLYQSWSYYVFRARVSGDEIRPSEAIPRSSGGSTAG